jgi:integrase
MGIKKRGDVFYCRLKIEKREFLASCATGSKMKAEALDDQIKTALRQQNPDVLDNDGRDLARRLLGADVHRLIPGFIKIEKEMKEQQAQGITLFEACEKLYSHRDSKMRDQGKARGKNDTTYRKRLKQSYTNIILHLGTETPALSISVEDIEEYRDIRLNEGAAPATINKEVGVLSKVFSKVLIKKGLTQFNPCRQVEPLSTKDSVRQVYVSQGDFLKIHEHLPDWFKPLALLAYWCAMRAGETRELRRNQIDLKHRIIRLNVMDTKERNRKLVPIPLNIVDDLSRYLSGPVIGLGHVFLRDGQPITKDDLRRTWERALKKAGLSDTLNFHDLRHTWRRNARKSGLDPDIRKAIMGHAGRKKTVDEGYDLFDEEDFVQEIDKFRVEFGETRVWVTQREKKQGTEKERTRQLTPDRSDSARGSKVDHPIVKVKRYVRKTL